MPYKYICSNLGNYVFPIISYLRIRYYTVALPGKTRMHHQYSTKNQLPFDEVYKEDIYSGRIFCETEKHLFIGFP